MLNSITRRSFTPIRPKSPNKHENVNINSLTPLRWVRYERPSADFHNTKASREENSRERKQKRERERSEKRGETGEKGGGRDGRGQTEKTREVQKEEEMICTRSHRVTPTN